MDLSEDFDTDENILDDLMELQDEFRPLHDAYLDFLEYSKDIIPDATSLVEITSSVENSDENPTNLKEWMIVDQATRRKRRPHLYEFLVLLLHKPHYVSYAFYKDKQRGIFEISQPEKVAQLWEQVKNRQAHQKMTYDKFARAIRWYYNRDIMIKTNTRYTFQFSLKTLSCIEIDVNNNITIHSPVNSTRTNTEDLDSLLN